jgi:hypothetical protein
MSAIEPGTLCQCPEQFHGYVECGCAQDLLQPIPEATRLFIVSRTIASPTPSGHTVDVDVEDEIPVCLTCYQALGASGSIVLEGGGRPPLSFGPLCRCGHRGSKRVGESALLRQCQHCGETFAYRLHDGHLVAMSPLTALALDEQRATGRAA